MNHFFLNISCYWTFSYTCSHTSSLFFRKNQCYCKWSHTPLSTFVVRVRGSRLSLLMSLFALLSSIISYSYSIVSNVLTIVADVSSKAEGTRATFWVFLLGGFCIFFPASPLHAWGVVHNCPLVRLSASPLHLWGVVHNCAPVRLSICTSSAFSTINLASCSPATSFSAFSSLRCQTSPGYPILYPCGIWYYCWRIFGPPPFYSSFQLSCAVLCCSLPVLVNQPIWAYSIPSRILLLTPSVRPAVSTRWGHFVTALWKHQQRALCPNILCRALSLCLLMPFSLLFGKPLHTYVV